MGTSFATSGEYPSPPLSPARAKRPKFTPFFLDPVAGKALLLSQAERRSGGRRGLVSKGTCVPVTSQSVGVPIKR